MAQSNPSAPNGLYYIQRTGAAQAYVAFCDVAGSGWELAMTLSDNVYVGSNFSFSSPYCWEGKIRALLNNDVPDPATNTDAKFQGFVSTPASSIRGCSGGLYDTAHCLSYTLPSTYTSLQHMFATVSKSSTRQHTA